MHGFDIGLLMKVCYPKRSYSPLSNFLSDLWNGAYYLFGNLVLIYFFHLVCVSACEPYDTQRTFVAREHFCLFRLIWNIKCCGWLRSICTFKSIFNFFCYQFIVNIQLTHFYECNMKIYGVKKTNIAQGRSPRAILVFFTTWIFIIARIEGL